MYDSPTRANFYCGAQHRFIRIPGDFPDRETAEKACAYDYSQDCKIPLKRQPPSKKPWYRKIFP